MLSIIIPTLNEEKCIEQTLRVLSQACPHAEIIVVDGGSSDQTIRFAKKYAEVFVTKAHRAIQMNTGARHATGSVLVFASADTHYPFDLCMLVEKVLQNNSVVGGGFFVRFTHPHWFFRLIEYSSNLRARHKLFYLDQSLFVRRDVFWKVGGFPSFSVMEETALCEKIASLGSLACIPRHVYSSPRRFLANGIMRTWVTMGLILILYHLGFSQSFLKKIWSNLKRSIH